MLFLPTTISRILAEIKSNINAGQRPVSFFGLLRTLLSACGVLLVWRQHWQQWAAGCAGNYSLDSSLLLSTQLFTHSPRDHSSSSPSDPGLPPSWSAFTPTVLLSHSTLPTVSKLARTIDCYSSELASNGVSLRFGVSPTSKLLIAITAMRYPVPKVRVIFKVYPFITKHALTP